jgi:hypothetical protein
MNDMRDGAIAPISGYIYQIEKALLLMPDLAADEFLSIEQVDDVAKHDGNGTVLLSVQVKHSISKSGTTFQDTSLSLWRTLEIWITKLREGIFNSDTTYCCSTNKEIPENYLIRYFESKPFEEIVIQIQNLLENQKEKLTRLKRGGKHVQRIILLIEYALQHKSLLKTIFSNLKIAVDNQPKEDFINRVYLNSRNITQLQKDAFYDEFCGWVVNNCQAKWKNSNEAIFNKEDFDTKYQQIRNNPSIMNAIFRNKKDLIGEEIALFDRHRETLFVKQIQDLIWNKQAKERAINDAVMDYIYSEIELNNIVKIGDYTVSDFDDFIDVCKNKWQDLIDILVIRDIDEYTEKEKNDLAISIFNKIMKEIELKFKSNYSFTESTKYIQNGTFLKLSDEPQIGWHPEWESKYIGYGI